MDMKKINIIVLILVIINTIAIVGIVADHYGVFSDESLKLENHVKHTLYIGLGNRSDDEGFISDLKAKMDKICEEKNVPGYTLFETQGFMIIDNKTVKQKTLVFVFDRLNDDEMITVLEELKKYDKDLVLFIEKSSSSAGVYQGG